MPPSSPPSSKRLKILALLAVSGSLLCAGHVWLNTSPDQPDAGISPKPGSALPGTKPKPKDGALSGEHSLSADAIAQAYARAPQEADARFKGQRLRLQGVVRQTEAGQGQVLLITLGTGEDPGLRVVVNMAEQSARARAPALGHALELDCLNQGLLMGEPVWGDCRLRP